MHYFNLLLWLVCIAGGFFAGSIMFSYLIPKAVLGRDVTALSQDHNPGATNVFMNCGQLWGIVCLSLDMLKGFLPVFISYHILDTENLWFGLVMAAPVLGHAIAPLNHFRGGKCIATAFGTLLGLFPVTHIVLVLAAIYIVFSTILKISPNRLRSIASFGLFGLISLITLIHSSQYSVAIGCALISATAIWKHTKRCLEGAYTPASENI